MPAEHRETDLAEAIARMDERGSLDLLRRRLEIGEDPAVLMEECRHGMELVGKLYEERRYYISALIMAGEIFREASEILLPLLTTPTRSRTTGTFLIATVKGDIHDIGKNIASTLLDTRGFDVVDLGVDVTPERIAESVTSIHPDILGLSCLLTSVFDAMRQTVAVVRERTAEWQPRLPVIIGGAPLSQTVCDQIGADGWCTDAAEGVRIVEELLAQAGAARSD